MYTEDPTWYQIKSMRETPLLLSVSLSLSYAHLCLILPRDTTRQDVAGTGMLVLPACAGAVHGCTFFGSDDDGVCSCKG
jgi:hypothetical protein